MFNNTNFGEYTKLESYLREKSKLAKETDNILVSDLLNSWANFTNYEGFSPQVFENIIQTNIDGLKHYPYAFYTLTEILAENRRYF